MCADAAYLSDREDVEKVLELSIFAMAPVEKRTPNYHKLEACRQNWEKATLVDVIVPMSIFELPTMKISLLSNIKKTNSSLVFHESRYAMYKYTKQS